MKRVPPPSNLFAAVARLAFFNPSGFAGIGNTRQSFLSSLSPLIAFVVVGSAVLGLEQGWRAGLTLALQMLCLLLGLPVVSNLMARRWQREDVWLSYATALNWCLFASPAIGFALVSVAMFAGLAGPSPQMLAYGLVGLWSTYLAALLVFLGWRGLRVKLWRAIVLLLLIIVVLVAVQLPTTATLDLQHGSAKANLQT